MKIFVVVDGDNCKTPAETFCPGDRKGLMRSIGDEPYTPTILHMERRVLYDWRTFLLNGFTVSLWVNERYSMWISGYKFCLKLDREYLVQNPEKCCNCPLYGWGLRVAGWEFQSKWNLFLSKSLLQPTVRILRDRSIRKPHIYWWTDVWKLLKVRQQFPMGPVLNSKI